MSTPSITDVDVPELSENDFILAVLASEVHTRLDDTIGDKIVNTVSAVPWPTDEAIEHDFRVAAVDEVLEGMMAYFAEQFRLALAALRPELTPEDEEYKDIVVANEFMFSRYVSGDGEDSTLSYELCGMIDKNHGTVVYYVADLTDNPHNSEADNEMFTAYLEGFNVRRGYLEAFELAGYGKLDDDTSAGC